MVLGTVWRTLQQQQVALLIDFKDGRAVALGATAAVAALAVNQLLFASSDVQASSDLASVLSASGPVGSAALMAASVVLAPATEELLYRGFLLQALRAHKLPEPGAVGVSALLFAAAHFTPAGVPQLMIVGSAFGAAAVAANYNLAAPWVAHALYNGALFVSLLRVNTLIIN